MEWFQTIPLTVMPFAVETVRAFRESKFPLALVSSAPMDEILVKVKRMGIEHLFDTIVSRSDVKEGKPFPDMYLLAAKRLGLSPREMVAFEDTPSGVTSAHAAGMVSVAVPNDFSRRKPFPDADAIIPDLRHALPFVEELRNR